MCVCVCVCVCVLCVCICVCVRVCIRMFTYILPYIRIFSYISGGWGWKDREKWEEMTHDTAW